MLTTAKKQLPEPGGISRVEALELLSVEGDELEQLIRRAARARERVFGREVRLCAISNARSGACPERCDFCAQSAHFRGTGAPTFPTKSGRRIADEARRAEAAGAREFSIVTSGRSLTRERDVARIEEALRLIGEETRLERCASLGELPDEVLVRLSEAGMLRYHHNVETAPSFHHEIVHTHDYDDEVRVIERARAAGLLTCCGGILGMGESPEQRVELAFALRELDPDCVPLNFLDPRPGTPLHGIENDLSPEGCLRIISIFRLVMPDKPIFVCGGREANLGPLQRRMFEAGASGTMVGDYLTTSGQAVDADHAMIRGADFAIER
jgi:biotin synthase